MSDLNTDQGVQGSNPFANANYNPSHMVTMFAFLVYHTGRVVVALFKTLAVMRVTTHVV